MTDVAIIGGGFAGSAVALHVARLAPSAGVVVLEPRAELGRGLAYDSTDPSHRINVPAGRMSLLPDDEEHFVRWISANDALRSDPGAIARDGFAYPRRSAFGTYVASQMAPLLNAKRIQHVQQRATALQRHGERWRLSTSGGSEVDARVVVIATTHPPPVVPEFAQVLAGDPRGILDPLTPAALDVIADRERVLIVGTGLTMADIVASLHRRGHAGQILAVSRHGLRSQGHAAERAEPTGDFVTSMPHSASLLLRRIRAGIDEGASRGISWHAVLDAVREQGLTLWLGLPPPERSRIIRHLRTYWDVHRFRVAPQLEDIIAHKIADASLQVIAATVGALVPRRHSVEVALRARASRVVETVEVDRVVLATGPAHNRILAQQSFLAGLAAVGAIQADALGLGLACDTRSQAVARDGTLTPNLFIAGPLARATFGELMGLPQVSRHALDVAQFVASTLQEPTSMRATAEVLR